MNHEILIGDVREVLPGLGSGSVDCCVTSPPYFGLRDYGHGGQIGLEETPDRFVETLVGVFREVKRVLRDDGVLWLNLGDSYVAKPNSGTGWESSTLTKPDGRPRRAQLAQKASMKKHRDFGDLPGKNLIGIPWRVAFALQADGWVLRQDIIWSKPNPLPESVRDRCTKAHEYIFLLSKGPRYFYDADAIRDQPSGRTDAMGIFNTAKDGARGKRKVDLDAIKGCNKRSVWTVSTKPYSEAHFATFPPELIEPCILAGCPEGGVVLDPFAGSGTVGQVCEWNRRNSVLVELNPEYGKLIEKRIHVPRVKAKGPKVCTETLELGL